MSGRSESKSKLSRRKFLLGSAATAASAAVTVNSERANAFFNTFGFMKKPAGSGQTSNGYAIGQSLRFNSAATTCLTRTPSVAGNQQTFTISFWVKRSTSNSNNVLFCTNDNGFMARFSANGGGAGDILEIYSNGGSNPFDMATTQVFRDPSAFGHLLIVGDMTNATATNRLRVYWNGSQITSWVLGTAAGGSISPQNTTGIQVNSTAQHSIGTFNATSSYTLNGYLAEVYLIDGTALDPSAFGQIDANSGQWIPKSYSGSYGTNGFYLNFSDATNNTATTLGKDSAPLSGAHTAANNWTPNNFNTYDQVLDSPTNNFCTWNPLQKMSAGTWYISHGTLRVANDDAPGYYPNMAATFSNMKTPFYFEVTADGADAYGPAGGGFGGYALYGLTTDANLLVNRGQADSQAAAGLSYDPQGVCFYNKNWIFFNGSTTHLDLGFPATTLGTVRMIACDPTTGKVWFGQDGSWYNSGNPTTGMNPTITSSARAFTPWCAVNQGGGYQRVNFGQGGQTGLVYDAASGGRFKYTPPTGFKALCAANLPVPAIKKPSQYFDVALNTGANLQTSINALGFAPDLTWAKDRQSTANHMLVDTVRGAYQLASNTTSAESAFSGYGGSNNHVAWCWKKGATPGFDIQTYTGAGAGTSFNHTLGAIPSFVIVKNRDAVSAWDICHTGLSNTNYFIYFDTQSQTNAGSQVWSLSASSVSFPTATSNLTTSGQHYAAYLWTEVAGFSKFGSYTGNSNADGPFVYCGFKPRFIMIKCSSNASTNWILVDTTRDTTNPVGASFLEANVSNSEANNGSYTLLDALSNGFKLRYNSGADGGQSNVNGYTYIFAAFAEAPFKYATAR